MSGVVFEGNDRAVIHNRETGQVLRCSIPTALENVTNSGGVWVHGHAPDGTKPYEPGPAVAFVPEPAPSLALVEDDVLPLPVEDRPDPLAGADDDTRAAIEGQLRPISDEHVHVPAATDPLDHDGDGRKGGAKPKVARGKAPADPERAAVVAALKAAGIKYFKAAPTEKLKTLLPG